MCCKRILTDTRTKQKLIVTQTKLSLATGKEQSIYGPSFLSGHCTANPQVVVWSVKMWWSYWCWRRMCNILASLPDWHTPTTSVCFLQHLSHPVVSCGFYFQLKSAFTFQPEPAAVCVLMHRCCTCVRFCLFVLLFNSLGEHLQWSTDNNHKCLQQQKQCGSINEASNLYTGCRQLYGVANEQQSGGVEKWNVLLKEMEKGDPLPVCALEIDTVILQAFPSETVL